MTRGLLALGKPTAMGLPIILLLALLMGPLAGEIAAAEAEAPVLVAQLGEDEEVTTRAVVVTVNRVIQDVMDIPQSVSVITAEDIAKMPATTITEILTRIPGLDIALDLADNSPDAGTGHISLRGESTGRTLVLINGVKTVEANYGYSVVTINPSQIERIEVVKGPSSVLYGPEAIGGVVNIITKKGGGKPLGFSAGTVFDSSTDGWMGNGAIFGRLENGFNYRISADAANVGDRKFPSGAISSSGTMLEKGVGSGYRNRNFAAQVGYDWDKYSFNVQADRFESDSQTSRDVITATSSGIQHTQSTRDSIIATFTGTNLTDYLKSLMIKSAFSKFDRYRFTEDYFTGAHTGTTDSINNQYTNAIQAEWQLGRHNVVTGFEWEHGIVELNSLTLPVGTTPYYNVDAVISQDNMAFFTQDQWSFTDKFILTVGLRQIWNTKEYKDWSAQGAPAPCTGNRCSGPPWNPNMKGVSVRYSDLIGNVGLVYKYSDQLAFRGLVSQGKRYPTLTQIFTSGRGSGAAAAVNVDLVPESSMSYEIGARYDGDSLSLDTSVFYTDARDFIEQDQGATGIFQNIGWAKTLGFEVTTSYVLHDLGLTPYANFTMMRREQTKGRERRAPASKKTRTPAIQGKVGLQYERPLDAMYFFSDLRLDFASGTEDLVAMRTTAANYPGWMTVNLNLGLSGGEESQYSVSLAINNILDKLYAPGRSANKSSRTLWAPARHIVLGVNYTY